MQTVLVNIEKIIGICHDNPPPPPQAIIQILPVLIHLMQNSDVNILNWTLKLLIGLLEVSNQQDLQLVACDEIIFKLNDFIVNRCALLKVSALYALIDIATRSTEKRQLVLDFNLLQPFSTVLTHRDRDIREQSVISFSRLVEFKEMSTNAFLNSQILSYIRKNLIFDDRRINKYTARVVHSVLSRSNEECLTKLVLADVISPFCELINLDDPETTKVSFATLFLPNTNKDFVKYIFYRLSSTT